MRITDTGTILASMQQLQYQRQAQDRLQLELSSGKRILTDSDHMPDAAELQDLRRQLGYVEQYSQNASRSQSLLLFTDASLHAASDVLLQAIQIGVQGSSSLVAAGDRRNLAEQLRGMKSQLVSLGNSTHQGQFVFGGSQNLIAPFSQDPNNGQVTFSGNASGRMVPVADGTEVQATFSGREAFLDGADVFATLDSLADAIEQGNIAAAGVQLGELEKARVQVSSTRSKIGLQLQQIEQVQLHLQRMSETLMDRASALGDANIAEIVSRLTLHETAVRATLFAQGNIGRRSLFDFIA